MARRWRLRHGDDARPAALPWSAALRSRLQNETLLAELCQPGAPRCIGVAGCHVGAGASTVALNLALLLRERVADPVWLVEADVRRPVYADWLGVPAGGLDRLAAAADDVAPPELATAPDPRTGLHVVAASVASQPLLLLQKAAPRLRGALPGRVIVDLPPVLDAPDATLVAPHVDAVLLVLEAEATRWEVAREARVRLDAAGAKVVGAVLNKKPYPIPAWLYRWL